MSLRRYRWPALLLLVLHLQACSTWRTSPRPVPDIVQDEPGTIRITLVDGATQTLEDPRLIGDSLTTAAVLDYCPRDRPDPCPAAKSDGEPLTVTPLDQVVSVQLREFSVGRTVGAVALTGVAVFGLLFAIDCAESDGFIC